MREVDAVGIGVRAKGDAQGQNRERWVSGGLDVFRGYIRRGVRDDANGHGKSSSFSHAREGKAHKNRGLVTHRYASMDA